MLLKYIFEQEIWGFSQSKISLPEILPQKNSPSEIFAALNFDTGNFTAGNFAEWNFRRVKSSVHYIFAASNFSTWNFVPRYFAEWQFRRNFFFAALNFPPSENTFPCIIVQLSSDRSYLGAIMHVRQIASDIFWGEGDRGSKIPHIKSFDRSFV